MAPATNFSPGSLIPGLPASVISAQFSPEAIRSNSAAERRASANAGRLTVSLEIPCADSNAREGRVSRQAINDTLGSVSRARALKSARFPIGVATRNNLPAIGHLHPCVEGVWQVLHDCIFPAFQDRDQ